jgi:hypothetical protein
MPIKLGLPPRGQSQQPSKLFQGDARIQARSASIDAGRLSFVRANNEADADSVSCLRCLLHVGRNLTVALVISGGLGAALVWFVLFANRGVLNINFPPNSPPVAPPPG